MKAANTIRKLWNLKPGACEAIPLKGFTTQSQDRSAPNPFEALKVWKHNAYKSIVKVNANLAARAWQPGHASA
eukprot:1301793-Heterocapsa_arctica.AAC.1